MQKLIISLVVLSLTGHAYATIITTGLQLHLDADALSGLQDGQTVSSWADLSGNGNDATSPGTATYIADALNGKPAVSITGSLNLAGDTWTGQNDDYFVLNDTIHNVKTVAMVFKRTSNVYYSWAPMFGGEAGTNPFHGDNNWGTAYFSKDYADQSVIWSDLWINGTSVGAGNGGWTAVPTDYHVMTLTVQDGWGTDVTINQIASSIDSNYVWGMDIAELLVYDQFLSNSDMVQVTQYLGDKYGIAVVPEPATIVLFGLGACLLRRKR